MDLSTHPLLSLLECNATGLKSMLTHYIDATVDSQFASLRNSIETMIQSGMIGPNSDGTAFGTTLPPTTQTNTHQSSAQCSHEYSNDTLTRAQEHKNNLQNEISLTNTINTNSMVKQEFDDEEEEMNEHEEKFNYANVVKCEKGICTSWDDAETSENEGTTQHNVHAALEDDQIAQLIISNDISPSPTNPINTKPLIKQECLLGSSITSKRKSEQAKTNVKKVKREQILDFDEDIASDGIDDKEDHVKNKIGDEIAIECTTNQTQPNLSQSNRHFQCPQCPKSFGRNSKLQTHLRVHSGERPFHCGQCDKSFNTKSNLTKHQLIHQNIKRFSCHECEIQFTHKHHLLAHLLTHSGERPFECRHCEKTYADLSSRNRHELAIHLHVKSYRCKQCGHTATQQSDVIKHIRMVHFGLPQTIKQQQTRNIIDDRDPDEFVEKV